MKKFLAGCLVFAMQLTFANSYHHEFEGISEVYNIRNLKALAKFLPQNPIIVEAGAYKGHDTLLLAKNFPTGRVYAFEPLESAVTELRTKTQSLPNVTVLNKALDSSSGQRKLYVNHGTGGKHPVYEFQSSLLKPTTPYKQHFMGPLQRVSCITLQEFCKKRNIQKVDMLWLSTEGSEMRVIKGAKHLLKDVTFVYIRSQLAPTRQSITLFKDLRTTMEKKGFLLLSHFYLPNHFGDALFIKKEHFNK